MNLKNAEAVCSRAEDLAAIWTNTTGNMIILYRNRLHRSKIYMNGAGILLKNEGMFLCIKGGEMSEEITGLKKRNKNISVEIINYSFPEIYNIEDKKLVIIKKIKV